MHSAPLALHMARLTLGSDRCQRQTRPQAMNTTGVALLAFCPWPTCWPPPLCRQHAHFLMLWKVCGEMTMVTPTCFSSALGEGGTVTREREPDMWSHALGKTSAAPVPMKLAFPGTAHDALCNAMQS